MVTHTFSVGGDEGGKVSDKSERRERADVSEFQGREERVEALGAKPAGVSDNYRDS